MSGTRCTPRWPRPRTRSSTRTGAPGTARRRRPRPTSGWPRSSSTRPAARWRAAGSRPPRPSWRPRPRSPPSPRTAPAGCSPRRGPSATPARSTRRWSCWSRSRPARWTRCRRRRSSSCAARSPSTSAASARRRGCWSARRGASTRSTPTLARTTHLKALGAAMWAGPEPLREAAEAARAAPPSPEAPRAVDLLVDAFALRVTEGYAAAAPALRRALDAVLALEVDSDIGRWLWLTGVAGRRDRRDGAVGRRGLASPSSTRHVQVARDMGALVLLQFGLQSLVRTHLLGGRPGRGGGRPSRRCARSPRRPGPRRSATPR